MMRVERWVAAVGLALLLVPAGRGADPDKVQKAIDRGVAYLKGLQGRDGAWNYTEDVVQTRDRGGPTVGATALAGLTLLECGVPPGDPAVQKAADVVRGASLQLTMTYALSLSVLFLDRLDDPADEVLIDSMGLRLLAGQNPLSGGWSYDCPPLPEAEVKRMRPLLGRPGEAGRPPKGQRTLRDLPDVIQAEWKRLDRPGANAALATLATDNSNTHLAVLALWVVHRQGVPIAAALKRIDHRFHTSQNADGGWAYLHAQGARPNLVALAIRSTPSMTCAALIGLALSHGSALQATLRTGGERNPAVPAGPDPGKDMQIRRALVYVANEIGKEQDWLVSSSVLAEQLAPGGPRLPGPRAPAARPESGARNLYYGLWTLERMAVAYGFTTIGKKDWYAWGSELLLQKQEANGSWRGEYVAGGCDTCFALLFLTRANLVRDVTAVLKGRVGDLGGRDVRGAAAPREVPGKSGTEPREKPAARVPGPARTRPADTDRNDAEADRLAAELVDAEGGKRAEVLARLRDSKGGAYTQALAQAIPKLTGEAKAKARDALADRLTRMTAATLKDKLSDDDPEVRRAAALASAMKEERSHIPRLIELLADKEPAVVHAAHAALKSLTDRDFGPEPDAKPAG